MDSNDDGTVPTDGTSGQLAAMTDVQLTMARAQLAMAEALLALSKGIVQSGPRSADAPEDVATFMHTGILASDLPLTFVDFQGPQRSLESLAECRKRIQLEFELSPESEYAARSEADKAVFLALGNFLALRAAALIPMKSTCDGDKSPAFPPTKTPPPQAPAPQPSRPAPPPEKS